MNTKTGARTISWFFGTVLIAGSPVGAWAGEPDVRAGLRLPELASELAAERLSEAVFTSLTPFTIEEVPVRLPADQRLDNEPVSTSPEPQEGAVTSR